MDDPTTRTEADAVADLVPEPTLIDSFAPADTVPRLVGVPPEWSTLVHDPERTAERPRRPVGTVKVHDAASFAAAVTIRRDAEEYTPVVYADEENHALVAILNDDQHGQAGWRDHRVQLELRQTVEWQLWRSHDGQLLGQEQFAEFIESGLGEIVTPAPGEMLDLAQTFHATTAGRFKGGTRLSSGVRQFVYEEEVDATAGSAGTVAIPDTIELAVRPFYGADKYRVDARFRFRLRSGELTLGYKIDRPHEIERAAFNAVREGVASLLSDIETVAGQAPAGR